MNTELANMYPELTLVVQAHFIIRGSANPNPCMVADEEHGEVIRYFIVSPANREVEGKFRRELVRRGLPYTLVRVAFSSLHGTYAEFKVTT